MPTQVTNYKCPACEGPLHFNPETGRLQCDYCDSTYDPAYVEELYAEKDRRAADAMNREDEKKAKQAEAAAAAADQGDWAFDGGGEWNEPGMKAYSCPSCGAELVCDETTAATSCPYYGNPTIVPGQLSGALKPDFIIPFKLDKKAAMARLKEHYKGKRLLPKSFSAENHIQEIKGVYVPFWLYDGTAEASATFHATRTFVHETSRETITTTEHYQVARSGEVEFNKVPVDGSSKMPDDYMDSLEPFDYGAMLPFSNAYLPGYLANKYDIPAEECSERADARCRDTALAALRDDVTGYATCTLEDSFVQLRRGRVHYALLPVWLLNTKWKDQNYLFAMNGQSGKMVGDLPVSQGKFWGWFGAIWAPIAAILALILFVL